MPSTLIKKNEGNEKRENFENSESVKINLVPRPRLSLSKF
jgi:hypothetical protein